MTEKQYALVSGSEILADRDGSPVITPFLTAIPEGHSSIFPDDAKWFPIEDVDTQPFELKRHWRDVPKLEFRDDHVARIYVVRLIGHAS